MEKELVLKDILNKYREDKMSDNFEAFKKVRFLLNNKKEFGEENIIQAIFKRDPKFKALRKVDENTYFIINESEYINMNKLVYLDKNNFLIINGSNSNTYIYEGINKEFFEIFNNKIHFNLNADKSEKIKKENLAFYDSIEKAIYMYYDKNSLKNNVYYKRTTNTLSFLNHDKLSYIKMEENDNIAVLKNSPYAYIKFDKKTNEISSFLLNDKLRAKLLGMKSINESTVKEVISKLYNTEKPLTFEEVSSCIEEYNDFFKLMSDYYIDLNSKDLSLNLEEIKKEIKRVEPIFNENFGITKKGLNAEDLEKKIKNFGILNRKKTIVVIGEKEINFEDVIGKDLFDNMLNVCLEIKDSLLKNLERQKQNRKLNNRKIK